MTQLERVDGTGPSQPIRQSPVRTAVRFPIRIPLTIQTEFGPFHGVTENVSANGLLFICDFLPELRSHVEFTMTMPSAIMGSDKDVAIHCIGRIVRREQENHEMKAAVVIDEYFLKA